MSLIAAIWCIYFTFSWYWNRFIGFNQLDPWAILKGVGLSLFAGLLVHRILWIILNKIDSPFNNPAALCTKMTQSEATEAIYAHLDKQGFFACHLRGYGNEQKHRGILEGGKGISLAEVNPFLLMQSQSSSSQGYEWRGLQTERAIDNIPGPIGSLFRFLGSATWYSGDFSIWLKVQVKVYGLDEDCTLVKLKFENIASPPVINLWGPFTRFMLFTKISSLVKSEHFPHDILSEEVSEPDPPADPEVDRSGDYQRALPPKDIKEFKSLREQARMGDAIAQFRVGEAYREGTVVTKDYKKAITSYEFAAERNNHDAQYALYSFYRDRIIVDPNMEKYRKLRRLAAEGGNPDAQYDMGCWYDEQDMQLTAFSWFERAAKLGHLNAMCYAAYILLRYPNSNSLDKTDPRGAAAWYLEAANRGSTYACVALANLRFKEGKISSALKHYRKAAKSGDAGAQLSLGKMYLYGNGIDQNLRRAQYWLNKAASQNVQGAEEHLHHAEELLAECAKLMA